MEILLSRGHTAQKMNFSIKDFFSEYEQIRSFFISIIFLGSDRYLSTKLDNCYAKY